LRVSRGIRVAAIALVTAGLAAPALRKRLKLPPVVVLGSAAAAIPALAVVVPRRGRGRDAAMVALNMWAYLAAYEMPHDDPDKLAARVQVRYPIVVDRVLGLGRIPTVRLQRAFARPGEIRRYERALVWCHWAWFFVPHGTVAYILARHRDRFPAAAARMYGVFDIGAVFYWAIPTAPPWWAARNGELASSGDEREPHVRRMMIEYGERYWGDNWASLYDVLGGNPLAAMPSLHFATSVMAAHLLTETGPVAGTLAWAYAITLGVALVYLGEHYAVDLVAGLALTETVRRAAPSVEPLADRISRALQRLEAQAAAA
jgi:membrane-associated phospholipid phosphatase